jgi:hypothetical protein
VIEKFLAVPRAEPSPRRSGRPAFASDEQPIGDPAESGQIAQIEVGQASGR